MSFGRGSRVTFVLVVFRFFVVGTSYNVMLAFPLGVLGFFVFAQFVFQGLVGESQIGPGQLLIELEQGRKDVVVRNLNAFARGTDLG